MKYQKWTIQKKPNTNIWWTRITINGETKAIFANSCKECLEELKTYIRNNKNGIKEKKQTKKHTLKQWFETWLKTYKVNNVRDGTVYDYQKMFKTISKYENLDLNELTELKIKEILNSLNGERTKQKVYILLKQLIKKAVINKLIKENTMLDINQPKYTPKEKTILNDKNMQTFINYCNSIDGGDFLLICLYQGLSRSECLGLQRENINFKNNTLTIERSIKRNTKDTLTKNVYRQRTIPIFESALPILTKYKSLQKGQRLFNLEYNRLDQMMRVLKEKLNLNINTHALRHTFITKCREQNIPLYIIQSWVGHKKGSKVTDETYTHINNEYSIEMAKKVKF